MHEAPTPASRAASIASRVPRTLTAQKADTSLGIPTSAAVWTSDAQPSRGACHAPGAEMSPATIPAAGSASRSTPLTSTPSRAQARRELGR